jgi:methylglutaconyl-CoA hydratase
VVYLNEPDRRNPLSPGVVEGLIGHFEALRDDAAVCAVVLAGTGAGFCAGADLRRMRTASPLEDRREYDRILALNQLLWEYPKPTIAAVHGFALGAGANLMTWCDIIVADEAARIGYPEVKAGVPSATVIPTLRRLVGRRQMLELTLLGEPISAVDAERIGMINRVAPAGTALEVATGLARRMAANDPRAMRETKNIARVTEEMSYREAMTFAKDARVIYRLGDGFAVRVPQGSEPAAVGAPAWEQP